MNIKIDENELKEFNDRGIINYGNLARMKAVMNKALSGKSIKVAFIGGSITAGAASTTSETCYAYLVYRWWENRFPNTQIQYINAGVGATTSQFGVARVEQDVLSTQPDMVFAEFSVNDENSDFYKETFEGLIRKILLSSNQPALFMFNNVFYNNGVNAQIVHNQIGKYYDLPIVSMKESIYYMIEQGIISNTDISSDNLHPNDLGHELVAGVIKNLLDKIYNAVINDQAADSYCVPDKTVTQNRYFNSIRHYNLTSNPILNGFVKDETVKNGVWDVFRYGWSAKDAGSSIRFEIEGSIISAQFRKYALHPAPIAKIIIDGDVNKASILDANFDETWGDKLELQDIVIDGPVGKHTVEIVITNAVENKEFYLASIITA